MFLSYAYVLKMGQERLRKARKIYSVRLADFLSTILNPIFFK